MSDGKYYSGEILGNRLRISRAAVWKKIKLLEDHGVVVERTRGKGYRLANPVELLDRKKLSDYLDKLKVNSPISLVIENITGSTNELLLQRVDHVDFHGTVIMAEYQTAGRGRHGNSWIAPYASGICLSIGWCFDPEPDVINLLSLAVGVACANALKKLDLHGIGLKWPNDIYFDGAKLGGILIESRAENGEFCKAVIGIGLNYALPDIARPAIDQPVTDMHSVCRIIPSRNVVAAALISETINMLADHGVSDARNIVQAWREYDCVAGKRAELINGNRKISGDIVGVDDHGALIMSVNNVTEKFYSGEISLRVSR